MNNDRRYNAGRPYYAPKRVRAENNDRMLDFAATLLVGSMLGALVALMVTGGAA